MSPTGLAARGAAGAAAVLCALLSPAAVHAATYYVDTAGSDSPGRDGSSGQAWRTLGYALTRVAAGQGHVVHLNAGTFVEAGPLNVGPGITVEGAGQSSTTLRSSNTNDYLIKLNSESKTNGNQQVRALTIDGNSRANARGVQVNWRENVKVLNVSFNNLREDALAVRGAGWAQGKANRVSGIEVANCAFNNSGNNTNGFFKSGVVLIGTTDGASIHHCTINAPNLDTHGIKYDWNAAGNEGEGGWNYGLKVYDCNITLGGGGFSIELFNAYNGCDFYNNTVNRAVSMGGQKDHVATGDGVIDARIHHNRIVAGAGMAVECQGGDFEIDNNYISDPGTFGIAIWNAGDEGPRRNYFIHHNVFDAADINARNTAIVIESTRGAKNAKIYNNTFYNLERGLFLHTNGGTEEVRDVAIKNNVFQNMRRGSVEMYRQTAGTVTPFTDIYFTHNVHYGAAQTPVYGDTALASNFVNQNNWVDAPGLTIAGPRPDPFFRPAGAASFVVDKGTTAGLPALTYSGTAPDLGRYEWAAAATAPVGKRIALRAVVNGRYASCNLNDPARSIMAQWATGVGSWEKFDVVDAGGGFIALKAANNGLFVSNNLNSAGRLQAQWATAIGSWEKFQWVDLGGGKIALKADNNGKYVSCSVSSNGVLFADLATGVGTGEQFEWFESP